MSERLRVQQQRLQLPTTIGSFPQTDAIRQARHAWHQGRLDAEGYRAAMQAGISHVVAEQEALGLDVLVHGATERSDMLEYCTGFWLATRSPAMAGCRAMIRAA